MTDKREVKLGREMTEETRLRIEMILVALVTERDRNVSDMIRMQSNARSGNDRLTWAKVGRSNKIKQVYNSDLAIMAAYNPEYPYNKIDDSIELYESVRLSFDFLSWSAERTMRKIVANYKTIIRALQTKRTKDVSPQNEIMNALNDTHDSVFIDAGLATICHFHIVDSLKLVNKQGKIVKRVVKTMRQCFNIKIDNRIAELLGNIVNNLDNSPSFSVVAEVIKGDDIREARPIFGDSSSCFWGFNSHHRTLMSDNPGTYSMLRVYDTAGNPISRAFMFTNDDSDTLLFNAYGTLSLRKLASVYSHLTSGKMTVYEHTRGFRTQVYTNGGTRYVVTSKKDGDIYFECHADAVGECCYQCNEHYHEDDMYYSEHSGHVYCPDCYSELFSYCHHCEGEYYVEDTVYHNDEVYCDECASDLLCECAECAKTIDKTDALVAEYDDDTYCEDCFYDTHIACENCDEYVLNEDSTFHKEEGCDYCTDCYNSIFTTCPECDETIQQDDSVERDGKHYCADCEEDIAQNSYNQLALNILFLIDKEAFEQSLIKLARQKETIAYHTSSFGVAVC